MLHRSAAKSLGKRRGHGYRKGSIFRSIYQSLAEARAMYASPSPGRPATLHAIFRRPLTGSSSRISASVQLQSESASICRRHVTLRYPKAVFSYPAVRLLSAAYDFTLTDKRIPLRERCATNTNPLPREPTHFTIWSQTSSTAS